MNRQIFTYRLVSGESVTGIMETRKDYGHDPVMQTEYVTPVIFHEGEDGDISHVTTNQAEYPTVMIFMAHVVGKAMIGAYEVNPISVESETDSDTEGDEGSVELHAVSTSVDTSGSGDVADDEGGGG
jgi:hypothetical protein